MKKASMIAAGLLLMLGAANAAAEVQYLNSSKSTLPFSEAVKVGNTLYLSGKLGIVPGTQELAAGGVEAETHQTLKNIRSSLEAHGYSMRDVVKCTVFLADIKDFAAFNAIYRTYFDEDRYPARSTVGATDLALNARIEIECMAAKD